MTQLRLDAPAQPQWLTPQPDGADNGNDDRAGSGLLALLERADLSSSVRSALEGAALASRAPEPDAERVKDAFKQEFAAKASNKEEFDALMKQVYGDNYDKGRAEQYRQQALRGDFSFLPDVKFVDHDTLRGGRGAYNEAEGVVYIDRDLATRDPAKAAQVYVEEAGAHLDAKLNTRDTQGDEGEMFRRLLGGEHLSQREIDAIHNDDDRGKIVVDGKEVAVEFWGLDDIGDAISDGVDAVGDAASDVVDTVGDAASDAVDAVGGAASDAVDLAANFASDVADAFVDAGQGLVGAASTMLKGVVDDLIIGTLSNLFSGRIADAFDSVVRGVDRIVFQGPRKFANGFLEGAGQFFKGFTHLIPGKVGAALSDVVDRVVDCARTVVNAYVDVMRNTIMMPARIVAGVAQDAGKALKAFARGDIGDGFKCLGMAAVNAGKNFVGTWVDSAVVVAQGVVNIAGDVSFTHAPARPLTAGEKAYLKSVYGDSLDVDDMRIHHGNLSLDAGIAPHTLGNDIYLPDDAKYWNDNGTLTDEGKLLLVHESFHAYQGQHEGNGYIHDALLAQVGGIVGKGDRNAGYDFTEALQSGKPFSEWNPEQQAEFIETMARARDGKFDSNKDGKADKSYDLDGDHAIDAYELALAFADTNRDGWANDGKTLTPLSQADLDRALALWTALREDRPDHALV